MTLNGFVKRSTSMFYSTGATVLGSARAVDDALAGHADLRWETNTVVLRWPDGREQFYRVRVGNRQRVAQWVNKFNDRVTVGGNP